MNSIFSYDSKFMQTLMFIGDLMILNILYLLCCIPLFTIGAAQAGLYSAAKVLLDKEDDSSSAKAFFKGFRTGFGTVTLAWGLMTILLVVVLFFGYTAALNGASLWFVCIGIAVCTLFQCLVPAFHARFGCTAMQLIRNSWFLLFAHPLRSIVTGVLIWLPVGVFLVNPFTFMLMTPVWGAMYYSTAALFIFTFFKKPFQTLIDHFNETHGNAGAARADTLELPPEAEAADEAKEESEVAAK